MKMKGKNLFFGRTSVNNEVIVKIKFMRCSEDHEPKPIKVDTITFTRKQWALLKYEMDFLFE
tara:strand:- start:6282 stop:6467 length:186 start_codon:yes stop_codon:yes gene_type:complete